MTILDLIPNIYLHLSVYILIFTRISAFFATFILFHREHINARILIALSSVLSMITLFNVTSSYPSFEIVSVNMALNCLFEFLIGFLAGLILNILLDIFSSAGQIISTQIGLSFASVVDPSLGSMTSLSKFYAFFSMIFFFDLNGHLIVITTLLKSFDTIRLNSLALPTDIFKQIFAYSSVIFSGGVLLSIVIMVSTILVNISFAVMTRFAPQFNIFSIGITLTLIFGLVCICESFNDFVSSSGNYIIYAFNLLNKAMGVVH